MPVEVAVKLTTPPGGDTGAVTGPAGSAAAGPRVEVGSGASQTGEISDPVGPATLPVI